MLVSHFVFFHITSILLQPMLVALSPVSYHLQISASSFSPLGLATTCSPVPQRELLFCFLFFFSNEHKNLQRSLFTLACFSSNFTPRFNQAFSPLLPNSQASLFFVKRSTTPLPPPIPPLRSHSFSMCPNYRPAATAWTSPNQPRSSQPAASSVSASPSSSARPSISAGRLTLTPETHAKARAFRERLYEAHGGFIPPGDLGMLQPPPPPPPPPPRAAQRGPVPVSPHI